MLKSVFNAYSKVSGIWAIYHKDKLNLYITSFWYASILCNEFIACYSYML